MKKCKPETAHCGYRSSWVVIVQVFHFCLLLRTCQLSCCWLCSLGTPRLCFVLRCTFIQAVLRSKKCASIVLLTGCLGTRVNLAGHCRLFYGWLGVKNQIFSYAPKEKKRTWYWVIFVLFPDPKRQCHWLILTLSRPKQTAVVSGGIERVCCFHFFKVIKSSIQLVTNSSQKVTMYFSGKWGSCLVLFQWRCPTFQMPWPSS